MSTTSPTTGLEPRRTEAVSGLFDALLEFSRSVRARGSDWATLSDDLSRGDLVTLGVVGVHEAIRPGHIAAKLGVDPSVVSRQLAGLHRLELVERGTDPADRRAELISLTAAGHERLREARRTMCAALGERLDHWDVDQVVQATAVVEDLGRRLHEPLTRPHPTTHAAVKERP